MKNLLLSAIFLGLIAFSSQLAAQTKQVLFLGNSYTSVNDLPLLTATLAASAGDTLLFQTVAPGGYTFQMHASDPSTLQYIDQGSWDFVVLQEQSQRPAFPISQVEVEVFPFAEELNDRILAANPCTETVFFMTWGRKNGDAMNCAAWPPICTYEGMDSLLNFRYRMMAEMNQGILAPAGALWRYIRANHPGIELYQPDESHPSEAGSYAAACAFYTVLFRDNPEGLSYDFTLSASDAALIRAAAKTVVYDSLIEWQVGLFDPLAQFTSIADSLQTNQITFQNESVNTTDYWWDFGDGNTSQETNPTHVYAQSGTYVVELKSSACERFSKYSDTLNVEVNQVDIASETLPKEYSIFPNPVRNQLSIHPSHNRTFTLRCYDAAGRLLETIPSLQGRSIWQPQGLPQGYYLIELDDNRRVFREQILYQP